MKKVIVTGSNGQLGIAINKQYRGTADIELINTDVAELDITNIDKVMEMVREVKPYAIINCAAYTNVNACETDVDNAYKINAIGPRNLSIAATQVGAKLVQVSTDYVLSGDGNRPYTEFDPTGPKGVYGTSKLAGENFVKEFAKDYFIIRTAWLYGEGKNFVKTMLHLSEKMDRITVVNDQFGTPTSAEELAKAIHYLLPTENYGLFHGTCEGSCHWAEFAKEIFRLGGKNTVVEEVTTAQYEASNPASAPRPAYSILDNYMLKLTTDFQFAEWHDAIEKYMGSLSSL
ncbi:dTDP-4-dehydrorhamnose reductase [Kineothrix sp. MB12-C1]|uniref:dTDP-4-dehydrorhamnose reductase n=1 Tax=Kineothrix sp. MB12-C1 TaxID=3070215 RepID=UPI0027D2C6F9|nr:dTDP-4-dehydrorhamnose reductase [Kineothrix sp. MB12-C1]WMC91612.1 dTDP-4-dehydrorhamnose reductase [Kineothrix sp. MB12-C1]